MPYDRETSPRIQRKTRRILTIVDMLAPYQHHWLDTTLIRERINERLGETFHKRTIMRDLELLVDMGMAVRKRMPSRDGDTLWQLRLKRSEPLQHAAICLDDLPVRKKAQHGYLPSPKPKKTTPAQ